MKTRIGRLDRLTEMGTLVTSVFDYTSRFLAKTLTKRVREWFKVKNSRLASRYPPKNV